MYELRIVRERRQGYGTVRRVRDAGQVYEAFREEFDQLDREMFVVLLKAVLAARLAGGQLNGQGGDHLLTLQEAAEMLHVRPDWLRRQKTLPFRIELSPGQVRYSTKGIERWIAARTSRRG